MLPPEIKEIARVIPDSEPDEMFMNMHRQMGYNFQAQSVRHLVAADDSGQTHIEVDLLNTGIAPFYKNWDAQLAVLDGTTGDVIEIIEVNTDIRTLRPGESTTITGTRHAKLDATDGYQIGLRIVQPGKQDRKADVWALNARNTYVVLANDVDVVEGVWDDCNALNGGWNIIDDVQLR